MRITPILCLAITALILGGCASDPRLGPQQPLTAGIIDSPVGQSPLAKIPSGPDAKLAVILTQNTIANTQTLRQRRNQFDADWADNEWMRGYGLMLDPSFALRAVAHSLKVHFGSVELVNGPAAITPDGFNAVALVDIYYEPLGRNIPETTARVTVSFYDAQLRYIAAAGSKEFKLSKDYSCCWSQAEADAFDRKMFQPIISALAEFEGNLNAMTQAPNTSKNKTK